jgi:hypothetical protein
MESSDSHLNIWFHPYFHAGLGDYIQAISALTEWRNLASDRSATIAYHQHSNAISMLQEPNFDFQMVTRCPDGFLNGWELGLARRKGYDWLGIRDVQRLYYTVTQDERIFAEKQWKDQSPRVCLQWHGSTRNKMHSGWPILARHVLDQYDNLLVLDQWNESPGDLPSIRGTLGNPRYALAVSATADVFIGHCSGPFWSALGNLVPSMSLFVDDFAHNICFPLQEPDHIILTAWQDLERIPIDKIIEQADELISLSTSRIKI